MPRTIDVCCLHLNLKPFEMRTSRRLPSDASSSTRHTNGSKTQARNWTMFGWCSRDIWWGVEAHV